MVKALGICAFVVRGVEVSLFPFGVHGGWGLACASYPQP